MLPLSEMSFEEALAEAGRRVYWRDLGPESTGETISGRHGVQIMMELAGFPKPTRIDAFSAICDAREAAQGENECAA